MIEPASSADPSGPAGASARAGPPGSGPRSPRASRGLPSQRTPPGLPSGNSRAPSGEPAPPAGQSGPDKPGQEATPGREGTGHGRPGDEGEAGVELSFKLLEPVVYEQAGPSWLSQRVGAAAGRFARFGSALVAIIAQNPLETVAVLVLGIGGAMYPPIWLIGALIVAISRRLDLRDKWLALAVPVLIVIFGTTLAIFLGGQRATFGSYAFEAWLAAGRLTRVAAVLGAIYLLWRVYKGPREPRRPPWSMPHRRG